MNDLHVLDDSRRGSAIAIYLERCDLLLERAFQQNYEVRQAFKAWLEPRLRQEADVALALLHEEPVYLIGRYLGIPHTDISPEILARANKLAKRHHW